MGLSIIFGRYFLLLLAVGLFGAVPLAAQDGAPADDNWSPLDLAVEDILACKVDPPGFNSFAAMIDDKAEGAPARGWKKIRSDNPLLYLYRLPQPVGVAGYQTQTVGLAAGALLAILDSADTSGIARAAGMTEEDAEIIGPAKYMGQKLVDRQEIADPQFGRIIHTRSLSVSNVTSLPGKTLYGCAYKVSIPSIDDEDEE